MWRAALLSLFWARVPAHVHQCVKPMGHRRPLRAHGYRTSVQPTFLFGQVLRSINFSQELFGWLQGVRFLGQQDKFVVRQQDLP